MASGAAAEHMDPLIWDSFFWGLLSAVSLQIGSFIGVTCLPGTRTRAILMSFGGGALLFALSIELFGHVLHQMEEGGSAMPVIAMEVSAVVGGVFFATLNYVLNVAGADVRKYSTLKSRFERLRSMMMRRLAYRIWKIPFFSVLSLNELKDLIQFAMYKARFGAGDTIMSDTESGIYFVISGSVRVQVFGRDKRTSDGEEDEPADGPPSPGPEICMAPSLTSPKIKVKKRAVWDDSISAAGAIWRDLTSPKVPRKAAFDSTVESRSPPLNEWILNSNQIFGDMTVLTGSYLKTVAVAETNTKVLVLPAHELARLLENNDAVREQVALRAVERLRQVPELASLPDHALVLLASQSSLRRFQAGDTVYRGTVDQDTSIICLLLGCVEVEHQEGRRQVLHGSRMLCTEHLKLGRTSSPIVASAIEPTSALIINREHINAAMAVHPMLGISLTQDLSATLPGQAEKSFAGPRIAAAHLDQVEVVDLESDLEQPAARSPKMSMFPGVRKSPTFIGRELGWENDGDEEDSTDERLLRLQTMEMGQITEHDIDEQEEFERCRMNTKTRLMSRTSSARKSTHLESISHPIQTFLRQISKDSTAPVKKDPVEEIQMEEAEPVKAQGSDHGEVAHKHDGHSAAGHSDHGRHRAVMVWLGIMIDCLPESLVIGILINQSVAHAAEGADPHMAAASAALPFVIGVFLSNLPESMSSSGTMKAHGMSVRTITVMWLTTTLITAIGAMVGAMLFPPGSGSEGQAILVASVEGLAAGAMLTMIAQTMMPEAFEQGGDVVGLSCLAGFLSALSVKLIPVH